MINYDAGATKSVVGDAAADIGVAYSSWLEQQAGLPSWYFDISG